MKLAAKLFLAGAAFYLTLALVYWVVSHDEVGAVALALTAGLAGMCGFYLLVTARRMPDQPEDVDTAEIYEADADYGFYSPHSWAPLMVGASAALTFAGLAFAAWMVLAGAVLVIMSSAYWVFEYYREPFHQI